MRETTTVVVRTRQCCGAWPARALLAMALLAPAAAASPLDEARQLHREGRYREAVAAYDAVAGSADATPADRATASNNACVVHLNLGEHREALAACERALELRREVGDELRTARTLNNLALTLQTLGRYDEAAGRYEEALAINRRLGEAESATQNLANLAGLAIQAGRYAEAMRHVGAAERAALEHREADWAGTQLQIARINRGVVYEKIGAFDEALDSFRAVLSEEGAIDDRQRALLEVNVGVIYRNLGDPLRAIERFERAAETFRRLGDTSGLSNALLNAGLAHHLNLERPADAESFYREALHLARASGDRPEEIQDLFYLGRLLLDLERPREAAELFERCLALSRESDSPEGRWSALAGLGRAEMALGDAARAAEHLELAMREIESVRSDLPLETQRADFFGDKRYVYAAAVQARGELQSAEPGRGRRGNDQHAFETVQRAKVRTLLDALGGSARVEPQTAAELRASLGDDVLIELFAAERDLYRWVVDRDGLRMDNLGTAEPILRRAAAVHAALAAGDEPDPAELARLAETLVGDDVLPSPGGALHVAADGALRYLPFELLPLPGAPGADTEILLDRTAVSYLPSGSTLSLLRDPAAAAELSLLAFGNPLLEPANAATDPAALLSSRFGLRPLPAAEDEIAALAGHLPGRARLFTGAEATEEAFRAAVGEPARALHLATHTVIDEGPARGAAILLTPAGRDDGLLSPREIAALDLRARLTVLAACRTAPASGSGDALATLTGAFLAAGSPAVIATLWEVGDRATAAFMDQLYWQLGRGVPAAEALRRTKQRLRREAGWDRPGVWAPYVLIGASTPVVRPSRLPSAWAWTVVVLLAAGAGWLLLRRRARPADRPSG